MAVPAEVKHMMIGEARAMQLCKRIRQNMTDARNDLLELYEGEGWRALGYASWRECVTAEFGEHRSTLYRQLEAAQVARELGADVQFRTRAKNDISERKLRVLAKAPEGTRAEVLDVATSAAGGEPTVDVVKAAVDAKWADPDATPAELVKAVVESVPKAARPKPTVPQCVEDAREEYAERKAIRDEVGDEEWLASLPLSSALSGPSLDKFKRDALDWRRFRDDARPALKKWMAAVKKTNGGASRYGFVGFRAYQLLSILSPDAWRKCPPTEKGGCDGRGVVGSIGECPTCFGRGYLPK